ncbi:hypothetical protein HanIR_Chr03g0105181 [Helianthus annuus]|nr:hypothetical protein HanIR_Chr03g0105181 [Helianthus annuus]
MEIWFGQHIEFQRLAWLKITGVPIHLWGGEIMRKIGGRFGEVFFPYGMDRNDLNLHFDILGVLVNIGERIDQNIKVWLKYRTYDVWVTEVKELWVPSFVIECHTPKIHTRSTTAWRRDMTRIKPPIILNM